MKKYVVITRYLNRGEREYISRNSWYIGDISFTPLEKIIITGKIIIDEDIIRCRSFLERIDYTRLL